MLIVAVVTPLISSQKPIFGFLVRQEAVFQVAVELAFLLYLALFFVDPASRPRRHILLWATLFLIVAWGVATVASQNPTRSFFSSRDRLTGYFLLLHLGAFFLMVASLAQDPRVRRTLLQVSVVTSGIVSLYGVGQLMRLFEVPERFSTSLRIFSTLGNSSFLASYLLFHIFFGGYLFLSEPQKGRRIFFVALTALNVAALFLTGTRGALIGLYVGSLGALLLSGSVMKASYRMHRRLALAVLIIIPAALIIMAQSGFLEKNFYLSRFGDIESLWTGGLRNRLLVWGVAWQGFRERPLVGWGPERFDVAFDKHFNPELMSASGVPETWFDRAHNIVFDTLVTTGVVGITSFSFFVAAILIAAVGLWRKSGLVGDRIAGLVFFSATIAYFIQGQFVFDTFGSYLPLFLLAGWVAGGDARRPQKPRLAGWDAGHPTRPRLAGWQIVSLAVVAFFIAGSVVKFHVIPARAQGLAGQAFSVIYSDPIVFEKQWSAAFSASTPFRRELWLTFTDFLFGETETEDYPVAPLPRTFLGPYVELAKTQLAVLEKSGWRFDSKMYYQAGKLENFRGALGNFDPVFAESHLLQALDLSPQRLDIYYELAETARLRGDNEKQFEWIQKALEVNEDVSFSWWNLGVAYSDIKDYRKAVEAMEKAITMGYLRWRSAEQIPYIVAIYRAGNGPIGRIVEFWVIAAKLEPQNPIFRLKLAESYAEKGEKGLARVEAEFASQLDPSLKSVVDQFIKSLDL